MNNKSNSDVNRPAKPVRQLQIVKDAAESAKATINQFAAGSIGKSILNDMIRSTDIFSRLEEKMPAISAPPGKPQWQIEKELNEAEIAQIQLRALRKQQAQAEKLPEYDQTTGIITFMGKDIQIPLNKNPELVCRVVLKNIKNMSRKWEWEEIIEICLEPRDLFDAGKIYRASRLINDKVAQHTTVKDFFLLKPIGTVQLNPKFLR